MSKSKYFSDGAFIDLEDEAPQYMTEENTAAVITLPASVVESQFSEVVIKGNTHNQLVTNGNFVNTTGFSGTSATISTANNVLTITGNGVSANTGCEMSSNLPQFPSVGDKMYYRCMARVMNANAASLSLIEVNSGANTTVQSVSNPVQNQWYLLSNVITVPADVGTVCKPRVFATYADAATANGKITETQLWQVFNLTKEYGAGNEPTKANCDLMFANYQATGVNSTLPVRLSSVGKNLFDGEWEIGTIDTATGSKISSSTWIRSKNFIRIMPSNNYTIGVWSGERYIFLYDINKKFIKYAFGDTLTALDTTNAYYVKIIHNSTDLAKQILIRFTVAPSGYEPYKSGGEAYITWGEKGKGDSLPNGTKDEFNESTGVYTQNIGSKVLQASDIVALETGGTNVDTITINKPTDFINYNTTAATTAYSLDGYITENVLFSSMDNVSNINKISSRTDNTKFRLIVAKGTFASLAATQVALAGKSLNYQLAAPQTLYYHPSALIAYPAGSVIIEPVATDYGFYDVVAGLGITNIALPISDIDKVYRVDKATGEMLDVTGSCTKLANGLGLTSTALATGDLCWFAYRYDSALTTIPTVSVTYAINTAAQIIANTEAIRDIGESLGRLGMGGDIGGILVSATAPSSPKVNELWIDIS